MSMIADWLAHATLPYGWERVSLRRAGMIHNGGTPSSDDENWGGEIPFVTPPDLNGANGDVIGKTARSLTPEGAPQSGSAPPGSVLVSTRAPVGHIGRIDVRSAFNQGCRAIEPGPDTEERYLAYALVAARQELSARGQGTTFVELSGTHLASVPILRPPMEEQRRIADFLDRDTQQIDALIAGQQKLIHLLRERRRAVVTTAVTCGLGHNEELTESNDPMVGRFPSRWTVKPLRYYAMSLDGRRIPLSSEERGSRQGNYPYYGASGVIDHVDSFLFDESLVLVSEDGANLLARSAPIAFVATGQYWVNNHAHVLRPLAGPVEYWAARIEAVDLSPVVTGAAQPKLTADALMRLPITAPEPDEQVCIVEHIKENTAKIDALIARAEEFIALARERRSALITEAVTGRIDVSTGRPREGA